MGPFRGHRAEGHLGLTLLSLPGPSHTPRSISPEGGTAPRAKIVSSSSRDLGASASLVGGSDIFSPISCSVPSRGCSPSLRLKGGGDLGLAARGSTAPPLFMAFKGACPTEATLCFRLAEK